MISRKKISTKTKHIFQKHKTGCGVACIAMILGCSYDQGMKIVYPRRRKGKKPYTSILKISKVLKKKNIRFNVRFVENINLKDIKTPCILGVRNGSPNSGFLKLPKSWHWVVYDKKVLDPSGISNGYSFKYCQKNTFIIFEILSKTY